MSILQVMRPHALHWASAARGLFCLGLTANTAASAPAAAAAAVLGSAAVQEGLPPGSGLFPRSLGSYVLTSTDQNPGLRQVPPLCTPTAVHRQYGQHVQQQQQGPQPTLHQQQQQRTSSSPWSRYFSTSSGRLEQKQGPGGEGQPLSKAFLSGKLSQEELWMAGVAGRIKIWSANKPELKERQDDLVKEGWDEYYSLLTTHSEGRLLSNQARSQLKLACLAVATYRLLLPLIGDSAPVEKHIAESMGSLYSPFLQGSLKLTTWVRKLLLAQDPLKMAGGTLKDIAKDMEGACDVEVEDEEGGYELKVSRCLFHEVFTKEELPQLLQFFCCQHNTTWLEAYEGHGVQHKLQECMARGDECCVMTVKAAASARK